MAQKYRKRRGNPLRCLHLWRNAETQGGNPCAVCASGQEIQNPDPPETSSLTGSRGPHGPPARLPQALYIGSRYFVSREAGWAGWASCMVASAPCPSGCTGQFLGLHPAMYRWPAAIRSGITKYLKTGPEHSSNNPEQKTTTSKHTCRIFSP